MHHKLLYVGKLEGLDAVGRSVLAGRLETLLLNRYGGALEDGDTEALAVELAGKLHSRQKGHSRPGQAVLVRGGEVGEGEDEQMSLKSFRTVRVREIGGEWLCWKAIGHLGIREFLQTGHGWDAREVDLLLLNLVGRLLFPTSELKTALWLNERSGCADMLDSPLKIEDDGLGRVARKLVGLQHELEDHLYARLDGEIGFGGQSFLYDLTNTYFEGRMLGSELAQFGRSKEQRSDCRLVSIALLTNGLGFVRRSHFYAGNIGEPGTFGRVLDEMGGAPGAGVLADAGIGTAANIAQAALRGVPYMFVVREGFGRHEADFCGAEAFEHVPSNGQRPYRVWVRVEEHAFEAGGQVFHDRLVLVKSEAKQDKEDSMVERQKQRMEQGLQGIRQSLSRPRGHRQSHQVQQRIGRLKGNNARVAKAFDIRLEEQEGRVLALDWTYEPRHEKRNGTYVIRTNMPVQSARQGWQMYHNLSTIEAVNRCCKTDLNMRPVHHQKDETIKAHLFLTLLACTIVTYLRHLLAQKGIDWSWTELVRIMNTQKVVLSEFNNKRNEYFMVSQWSQPEGKARQIYEALGYETQGAPGFFFKISHDTS